MRTLARLGGTRRGLNQLLGKVLVEEATRRRFRGDKETAFTLYREACGVAPGELPAWVGAAEIGLEEKRGREAMQLLEAASKQHPTAGAIRTLTLQALHER